VFGIDYASTADKLRNKDRDYFALAVKRVIPGGGMVLVDGVRKHLSKGEGLQLVQSMAGMYPTLAMIGVENIGKGEEFYNDLVLLDDIYGNPLPLMPISHGRRSKGDRFENGWPHVIKWHGFGLPTHRHHSSTNFATSGQVGPQNTTTAWMPTTWQP
jgi:hypothetical protein